MGTLQRIIVKYSHSAIANRLPFPSDDIVIQSTYMYTDLPRLYILSVYPSTYLRYCVLYVCYLLPALLYVCTMYAQRRQSLPFAPPCFSSLSPSTVYTVPSREWIASVGFLPLLLAFSDYVIHAALQNKKLIDKMHLLGPASMDSMCISRLVKIRMDVM
ncbi:hypothetical protein F4779DRAFT_570162 [Xylariaceae sp. FL0662B]|nr:hypothetical protein F4779DRAFT_570162 [Xylariaceae sp. FL0662B]